MYNVTTEETNCRVKVTRFRLTRSRRFNYKKFGGFDFAHYTAYQYADYLQNCSITAFIKACRPVGRPLKSEFFATISLGS